MSEPRMCEACGVRPAMPGRLFDLCQPCETEFKTWQTVKRKRLAESPAGVRGETGEEQT